MGDGDEIAPSNELVIGAAIEELLFLLQTHKPNDRGELDKIYAVATTDVQKLWAWWRFAHFGFPKIEGGSE